MKGVKLIIFSNIIATVLFAIFMILFIKIGNENLTICNGSGCEVFQLFNKNILYNVVYKIVTIFSSVLFIILNVVSILIYKLHNKNGK